MLTSWTSRYQTSVGVNGDSTLIQWDSSIPFTGLAIRPKSWLVRAIFVVTDGPGVEINVTDGRVRTFGVALIPHILKNLAISLVVAIHIAETVLTSSGSGIISEITATERRDLDSVLCNILKANSPLFIEHTSSH